MISHIIAGMTGMGKTTFVENRINKIGLDPFIFDVNGEYAPIFGDKFCFHGNIKDFLLKADKCENRTIVFNEATMFFKQQGVSDTAMGILVKKRHMGKPYGCSLIWEFHSIRKVPLDIIDLSNYMTLFKTNDTSKKVEQKFDDEFGILEAFEFIKDSDNLHEHVTLLLKAPPPLKP